MSGPPPGPTAPRARTAEVLLVVSALSFGTLPIFGKLAYRAGVNVQTLLFLRFLLAGLLVGCFLAARSRPLPPARTVWGLLAMGALGYVGQSAAYFNSLRYVPAAITSILLYTYPVIVTLLSVPIYRAPLGRARAGALLLALAGTILVAGPSGGLRWEGVVLGLASAAVYSAYILSGKKVMEGADPVVAIGLVCLGAAVAFGGFTLATGSAALPHDPSGWLAVIGLAVIATVVGAGAFLAGLRLTDPGRASLISTLEPVSTAALAAVIFGETLSLPQLAGGALVLLAVALVSRVS